MEIEVQTSELRASRVLNDKIDNIDTIKKDFSQILELEKQEVARKYQTELRQLRRLVIELKNKYSMILESKATEFETEESFNSLN